MKGLLVSKTSSKTLQTSFIVSGFPRCGTSLMMRCLEAGGIEILAGETHKRTYDKNEKHNQIDVFSDYEFENFIDAVSAHKKDWTIGKVFKVVCPFIKAIPGDRPLKIIFMLRNLHEVVTSLLAQGTVWEWEPAEAVSTARAFLAANKVPTHYVQLDELIKYPKSTCSLIAEFMEWDLDIEAMVAETKIKGRKRNTKKEEVLIGFDNRQLIHVDGAGMTRDVVGVRKWQGSKKQVIGGLEKEKKDGTKISIPYLKEMMKGGAQ